MPASDMIGGAAGQDPVIGGRHMGVGAHHQAGPAVEMMAHGLLLAGRLRVHVDDDRIRHLPERAGIELPVDRGEGIVERVHVEAAHDVDDEDALAGVGIDEVRAAPGRPRRDN